MTINTEQIFEQALKLHQTGQLAQADTLYRQVLSARPDHIDSLNLLGVVALQSNRNEEALSFLGKALSLDDRVADFHNNIAEAYRRLGRVDEAITHFTRASTIDPGFVNARQSLGKLLILKGNFDLAREQFSQALAAQPDFAETRWNLAELLREQGKFEEAITHYRKLLEIKPGFADAHNNLGLALKGLRELDEAMTQFQRAVSLEPNFVEARINLANLLRECGNLDGAAAHIDQLLAIKPDNHEVLRATALLRLAQGGPDESVPIALRLLESEETPANRSLFVISVKYVRPNSDNARLRALLARAVSTPWARPSELIGVSTRAVKLNPVIRNSIAKATSVWPARPTQNEVFGYFGLPAVASDVLLQCLLESAPICDIEIEQWLTVIRSYLLDAAMTDNSSSASNEAVLRLYCALARQCFINDYVFVITEKEREQVNTLRATLTTMMQADAPIPPFLLIALAAYEPLHSLPDANMLMRMTWPAPVMALLTQQILEPLEEREIRKSTPRLTIMDDGVSELVRRQYEENPYPCWIKADPQGYSTSVDAQLRLRFLLVPFRGLGKTDVDILVAGCGTGQQSVEIAQAYPQARVLAIDLSLASLGYAQRKTRAADLHNIEYGQADILKLGSINRTFDVIESTGVLHHLADPMAGWRVLLSLLRPGGFMHLGFYSRFARVNVRAVRNFIAQEGYQPVPDDIRRCRQELMTFEKDSPLRRVCDSYDFYSISACRDLLFHVQEHQLTLPEIQNFLAENSLTFLGFDDLAQAVFEKYRRQFPKDRTMTNLDFWHEFEVDNPQTFGGMYQFWIQKEA